jgi:hypothetical protein
MAVYESSRKRFVWPYLKREIRFTSTLKLGLSDVTCAYGYVGPLSNVDTTDDEFLYSAWRDLAAFWCDQNVVCVFARFNPLLENHKLIKTTRTQADLCATTGLISTGKTVHIDLTQSQDEIWRGYSRQLRQAIRSCQEAGLQTDWDPEWKHLDAFIDLYYETMERNSALSFYYFPIGYFRRLRELAGQHGSLIVTKQNGTIVSAGLVFEYGRIATLHLLACDSTCSRELSPNKMTIHDVQCWAQTRGNCVLHIGGGRGGQDNDGVFRFKSLFSRTFKPFYTGRWVLDQPTYDSLSIERRNRGVVLGKSALDEAFFPLYRAPFRMTPVTTSDMDGFHSHQNG